MNAESINESELDLAYLRISSAEFSKKICLKHPLLSFKHRKCNTSYMTQNNIKS
jgi:hypothetical protein